MEVKNLAWNDNLNKRCNRSLLQAPTTNNRENANFICLFPQDLKNLNHIFEDHVGSDMITEEFRQLCKVAWEKQTRIGNH